MTSEQWRITIPSGLRYGFENKVILVPFDAVSRCKFTCNTDLLGDGSAFH
ncbi:MAG TPA: hypothetical protein VGK19_05635 [Capsulimonadaceae bacterium]